MMLLPQMASLHGRTLDQHLRLNLWIALGMGVAANGLLAIGAMRHRLAVSEDRGGLQRLWLVEVLPMAGLTALFLLLGLRAQQLWAAAHYTGGDPAAMQVEVTGVQFVWYFRYPGDDAMFGVTHPELVAPQDGNPLGIAPGDAHGADDVISSELVLPAGREVDLRLRAQDVIHGFFVPGMRLKQNAVPGETAHVHFVPTTPGVYPILCTQLCGLGHYRMAANLRVLPADQFDLWMATRERSAKAR